MKVSVYKIDGTKSTKKVELDDSIFNIEPNDTVIYEDVRSYMANKRQGTAKTKGRTEVRGGGRKAYRQKGTGNARRGSIRSPLLKGGGTVFGPKPRDYSVRITKKMRQLARKSALTYKAREEAIRVIENFDYDEPKTSRMVEMMQAMELTGKKVLLLTAGLKPNVYKSGRNVQKLNILEANNLFTYAVLNADVLLIQEDAINLIAENLKIAKVEEAAA
ncbi:MAG: 50S ribosomal protein L4 [Rhodothermaceae bacterium]|nr:50S ribosomal protein L4 [Rhodothermaceae bacterium]